MISSNINGVVQYLEGESGGGTRVRRYEALEDSRYSIIKIKRCFLEKMLNRNSEFSKKKYSSFF